MSNIIPQITVDEFLTFKTQNVEILFDAQEYIKRVGNTNKVNKVKSQNNNNKKPSYQKYPNKSNWKNQPKFGNSNGNGNNSYNSNARSRPVSYDNEDDLLYTKFRSYLNKLSGNNINTISGEIKTLSITKREHMEKLIDFIFSKAVKETKFTVTYAILVNQLMTHKINLSSGDLMFADLFLKKCRAMFDECLSYDVELEAQYLDCVKTKVSKTFNFKDEVIGCINFVGELYNCRILNDRVATICLASIMKALESRKVYCIDIICNFIKTISRRFCIDNSETLNTYLRSLVKIKDSASTKEKFIIMDLIDHLNKSNLTNIKY